MDVEPLLSELAKAADVCLKPYRHALRFSGEPPTTVGDCSDCCLLIEARDADGVRHPERDLELEIYRSGEELNLMLSMVADEEAPMLWHGSHRLSELALLPHDGVFTCATQRLACWR